MREALNIINANSAYILIGLAALFLIVFIYALCLGGRIRRLARRRVDKLPADSVEGVTSCLTEQADAIAELACRVDEVSGKLDNMALSLAHSVQKVGMVRFNAFEDIGGEQSFAMVMLDGNNNGVALSSLYGRQDARLYAKPIANGEGERPLSAEERRALENALAGRRDVESLQTAPGR